MSAASLPLVDIALILGRPQTMDELLSAILESFRSVVRAERAAVVLFRPDGEVDQVVAHGFVGWDPSQRLPVSWSFLQRVYAGDGPLIVSDIDLNDEIAAIRSVQDLQIRMLVGAPIAGFHGRTGVLYGDSALGPIWLANPIDPRLVEAVGRLVGAAVDNVRLHQLQAFRADLLARMMHDLRTPLQVLTLAVDELAARHSLAYLSVELSQNVALMSAWIDHTLELSKMERSAVRASVIDLPDALGARLPTLGRLGTPYRLRMMLHLNDDVGVVQSVPEALFVVLDNLVANAVKHADEGSVLLVSARTRADAGPASAAARKGGMQRFGRLRPDPKAGFVEVCVHNEGSPIPPDVQANLFRPFVTGVGPHRWASTGLGLAIVAECVDAMGGRVWCESAPGQGTSMYFTIPRAVL